LFFIINNIRQLTSYLIKQKKFLSFIKNIQNTIETKNYKKEGYTFDSFVKKNWNITKARMYFIKLFK